MGFNAELGNKTNAVSQKVTRHVIPAKVGFHNYQKIKGYRRLNDINGPKSTSKELTSG
jgi:hypothetical protein